MIHYKSMLIFSLFTLLVTACAVRSIAPGDTMEMNMDFDLSAMDMRHGWAFFTPPKVTYVGNNDEDSAKRGKKLFIQHCQKCHGETGIGNGTLAKEMKIRPANLQNLNSEVTNTYLVVQINNGKGAMPKWEDFLNQQQAYDLTNYIRTLKKKQAPKK